MKISYVRSKSVPVINVQYDSPLGKKQKNKTFKMEDYSGVLNFALGLPDKFIMTCPMEVLDWAKKNNHTILKNKRWEFS